ncbi:CCA tRNA nucleotidyltransferase [Mesoaciditoga lauensis]|uniref:CCA tRNA nucleotidyltransferase n=1 Tax=Mesoaciditoga lauensis TaxID=1495039 RepID=UPI0005690DDF|nr:CCA tRNA nucleotidyltransferase [Mesoaciditoga lauensis]
MIRRDIPKPLANSLDNLYVVGGAVRDMLLGEKPAEYDLITTSSFEKIPFRTFAPSNNGKTVGVYYKGVKYDITRYEDLEEDLKRRDFTVNSMAIPVEKDGTLNVKKVIDPCNGKDDLEKRLLRTFKRENLFQDPVRVVRGLRFISEKGFDVEDSTLKAMKDAIVEISRVARERLFPPIEKFIRGKYFLKACEVAMKIDVERYLSLPTMNFGRAKMVEPICRWPVIFYKTSCLEDFVERVLPPNRVIYQIKRITYLASEVEKGSFIWTVKIKKDEVHCLIELLRAFKFPTDIVEKYEKISLNISSYDLQNLGIVGKNIPIVMERIWKEVLTSNIANEREKLMNFAKEFNSNKD